MHPLTSVEIGDLDLLQALNRGLVPGHYLNPEYRRSLEAYVVDYLKEEVFDEGLTRNVAAFSRFFEAMAYSHGDLTNYANIARDCGVDAKTVKEYYQILVDTLLGTFVEPWKRRQERQVIGKAPKFYLFDVGVAGALTRRRIVEERGELSPGTGALHPLEIRGAPVLPDLGYGIHFWENQERLRGRLRARGRRSRRGSEGRLPRRSLGLQISPCFHGGQPSAPRHSRCNERAPRLVDGIEILPWREFLARLWGGGIMS